MKPSEITEKTTPIKEFIKQLAKATKQQVVGVVANKVKRIGGESARTIDITLENGQVVSPVVRVINGKADIFRINVNGKQMPLVGDFSADYMPAFYKSVNEVAEFVRQGQKAFSDNLTKVKVKRPATKTTQSLRSQLEVLKKQADELDAQIQAKEDKVKELTAQLEQIRATGVRQ